MADFPAMPLWTDRYLSDTRHLSRDQHGAYLLLLMESWRRVSCSLPDDDVLLARLSCSTTDEWMVLKPVIMAFWKLDGRTKTWTQKGQMKERSWVEHKMAVGRDNVTKRWNKTKKQDTAVLPPSYQTDSKPIHPTPTPTPTPRKQNSAPKMNGHKSGEFEAFWEAYPAGLRKYGKVKAMVLFSAIVAGQHKTIPKAEAADIIEGARQRRGIQSDPEYHVAPEVWLRDERWLAVSKPALSGHLAQMEREGRL